MIRIFRNQKSSRQVWQIMLAIIMILMSIYFVKNEHLEVAQIRSTLQKANTLYIILGLLVTALYIYLQGLMYVSGFRTAGIKTKLSETLPLFLKRNLISVFLPAGGVSSLAFFTKPLTGRGISNSDIHYGSYIYGITGFISVAVVAIPLLIVMLFRNNLTSAELVPFLLLVLLIALILFGVWSFIRQRMVYRLVRRFSPGTLLAMENIFSTRLHTKHFILTLFISVVIDLVGVAHVCISMLALGFHPTVFIAFLSYIIMVMLLIVSPFLRGIGAIEVSMTYVFVQSGIPAPQAAAITLVFRFFEFWLPLLAGIGTFFFSKKNILLRVLPVFIIFTSGIINIVSAISPSLPGRIEILEKLLPKIAVSVSNYTVLFIGVLLIILSIYLLKGVKRAWRITLFLLAVSALGHLTKGIDYEEALVSIVAIVSLLFTYKLYNVRSLPWYRLNWWRIWMIAFVGVTVSAVAGTYFLEKMHMGMEYGFLDSLRASFRLIFLFDASGYLPQSSFGSHFISLIYFFSGGLLLSAVLLSLRPVFTTDETEKENDFNHAHLLVEKFGKSALDYFKYYPDKMLFFHQDGFIAYKIHGTYAVVLELPVCAEDDKRIQMMEEFERFCYGNGLRTFYYRVPESSLSLFEKLRKKSMLIGQEAVLDLDNFSLSGSKMHPLRNAINKAKNTGFTFHVYEPPIRDGVMQKLQQVSDVWLKNPGKRETVFSQGMFLPELIKTTTVMTIESQEEKIVAFLNIIPDYVNGEGTYDLIRITDDAPTGIIYFLLTEMFTWFKMKGITKVNLGMVAFAGMEEARTMAERSMKIALERLKSLQHFKGQYQFKDKFNPGWEKKYLVYDTDYDLLQFPVVLKGVSKP